MHTNYSQWVNSLNNALGSRFNSLTDVDYVWHCFADNWFILIEEKCYGAYPPVPQQDTLGLITQMCLNAADIPINTHINPVIQRRVDFRGLYLIQFEQTSPLDSNTIIINGKRFKRYGYGYNLKPEDAIKYLLRFGVLPKTPRLPGWRVFGGYPLEWTDSAGQDPSDLKTLVDY